MGFFDWLFGREEETKKSPQQPIGTAGINLDSILSTPTKEEEKIKRYVKVTDLNSIDKIDKIRKELLLGNVVVADLREVSESSTDKSSLQLILKELKRKVDEVHGEIARLSDERLIIIPSDMKFVVVAGKE